MKINKAACIPLVTHDPFFSIWSQSDHLYDADTVHWGGAMQRLRAGIVVDGKKYVFMGKPGPERILPQTGVDVTATSTEYTFENDLVQLKCRFTSPLILEDMDLVSRPCTYVDFTVSKKACTNVRVEFDIFADLVRTSGDMLVTGFDGKKDGYTYASMGRVTQQPLTGSDDRVTIDWGYAYAACLEGEGRVNMEKPNEKIRVRMNLEDQKTTGFILAYDDLLSINYFGQWRKAYWTEKYPSILHAISAAFADKAEVLERCEQLDREIEEKAMAIGGESYAFLCAMAYRHTIAAHKLIRDEEGNVIFLSKENDSNGCVGTVDVSYPSIPLFMLYNTEYVKGMLRPIFKFADCDVWGFDFAPHDVGRYPYAWGQAYAYNMINGDNAPERALWRIGKNATYPPFYMYPAGSDVYHMSFQMPVEECGNMLIMTAAVCRADGSGEFAKPYMPTLKTWKNYLVEYGADPGDQLCTDDFAGHLEHNVNLSAKAIMGIEAYAMLCDMLGDMEEGDKHHKLAKEMAASWQERALAGDHYALCFGSPDTWSLKYNLVWDKLWNCGLFAEEVYEKELAWYEKMTGKYGTPLDSRRSYTKSDWILWCAAMAKDIKQAQTLIDPIARYLEETPTRVPFSDWYDTEDGQFCMFRARSVQGGLFMPMLFEKNK